jgi:hypothetical protein
MTRRLVAAAGLAVALLIGGATTSTAVVPKVSSSSGGCIGIETTDTGICLDNPVRMVADLVGDIEGSTP